MFRSGVERVAPCQAATVAPRQAATAAPRHAATAALAQAALRHAATAALRHTATAVLLGAPFMAAAAPAGAAPAAYVADAGQSRLQFTGIQAGAPFKASFHKFTALVDFSPDALAAAHFDVTIELASVDSGDKDRDGTMRGADIFDVAHFPTAHYVTRSFTQTASGFSAQGALTLHGVTKDVKVDFEFTPAGDSAKLTGSAALKRLDFGVGQGDWKNTEWIGDTVKIDFSLSLGPRHP
jgi:polyisoprenoid-binding protein YceI